MQQLVCDFVFGLCTLFYLGFVYFMLVCDCVCVASLLWGFGR